MILKLEKALIKVVIVEDHAMFREWLGQLITKKAAARVCGEADNVPDGLRLIKSTRPDIAIVDISLRGSSGLELIKKLTAEKIPVPVLVLSMYDEAIYAERALHAGARGYITKVETSTTLLKAVRCVLDGGIYLGDIMTAQVLEKMSGRTPTKPPGLESLADRELEVFQLLGRGFNGREIAEQLTLGESTVESYRARIKEKLRLRNAAEVYNRAAQWMKEIGA